MSFKDLMPEDGDLKIVNLSDDEDDNSSESNIFRGADSKRMSVVGEGTFRARPLYEMADYD